MNMRNVSSDTDANSSEIPFATTHCSKIQEIEHSPISWDNHTTGPSADIEPTTKTTPKKESEPIERDPDKKQPDKG
jgi:hypothetical protein